MGGQGGQQSARGCVLPYSDVCMRAVKLRGVIVDVSQPDGDPGGVQVAGVRPPSTALAWRDRRSMRWRKRREMKPRERETLSQRRI